MASEWQIRAADLKRIAAETGKLKAEEDKLEAEINDFSYQLELDQYRYRNEEAAFLADLRSKALQMSHEMNPDLWPHWAATSSTLDSRAEAKLDQIFSDADKIFNWMVQDTNFETARILASGHNRAWLDRVRAREEEVLKPVRARAVVAGVGVSTPEPDDTVTPLFPDDTEGDTKK